MILFLDEQQAYSSYRELGWTSTVVFFQGTGGNMDFLYINKQFSSSGFLKCICLLSNPTANFIMQP